NTDVGKTLPITPAKENVKAFLAKVRGVLKSHPQAKAGNLILQLNPILRGWTNYHRHVVSKRIFSKVDNAIDLALWRWAKRRHPRKTIAWISQKYFGPHDGRNWVFYGEVVGPHGAPRRVHLLKA